MIIHYFKKIITFCFLSACLMNALPANADFFVEKPFYGNGQIQPFKKSVEGGESLNLAETNLMEKALPETDSNRFYFKARMNYNQLSVDNITNKYSEGGVTVSKFSKNQAGLEAAFGKTWKNWRLEGEVMINPNLEYIANPVLSGINNPDSVKSQLKSTSLMLNAIYDFEGVNFFRPYVMIGASISYLSIKTELTDVAGLITPKKERIISPACNAGIGVRYRAFKKLDIDLAYRYGLLGPVKFNVGSRLHLEGNSQMNGVSVGFMYYL